MKLGLLLFLAITFTVGTPAVAQELRVIETGSFHGEEVDVKDGELWLGLYKRADSYMLMPSYLTIVSVYDAVIDAEGQKSGKSISVPGLGEPLFLVKGGGFEQARPVMTIESITGEFEPGVEKAFELGGRQYSLRIESDEKGDNDFVQDRSKLIFSDGKTKQILYEVGECSFCHWRVEWAGDLDSDGRPDLYLFLTDHYNVSNQKLFLSSGAGSGKLLAEVAEFTTTGC
ncbi:MAG: hypothetical protein OEM82_15760 [Acidobacteriota bacterium]|nr:hypothetical protein [Acidobacteriota bacterium]MDH3531245.1 hypothetical protein [Acidobacteriota bacterium]